MICPKCQLAEMEEVEGVTQRTTTPLEEDKFGKWLQCPNCGHEEDIEGGEDI